MSDNQVNFFTDCFLNYFLRNIEGTQNTLAFPSQITSQQPGIIVTFLEFGRRYCIEEICYVTYQLHVEK